MLLLHFVGLYSFRRLIEVDYLTNWNGVDSHLESNDVGCLMETIGQYLNEVLELMLNHMATSIHFMWVDGVTIRNQLYSTTR